MQHQPSLREHASLDPVGLHACPTARLAGRGIRPFERKAKPRTVVLERVVIDNDTYIGPLLSNLGDFRRIGLACNRPVTAFVVPDVVRHDAFRDEIVFALMPNALPSVEQAAQNRFVCHSSKLLPLTATLHHSAAEEKNRM